MQLETKSVNLNGSLFLLPPVGNWIIMMQRFNGTLDFNRGWIDYRNGFGDIGRGEFWLGNEKVHAMTSKPGLVYQLRIEVNKSMVCTYMYIMLTCCIDYTMINTHLLYRLGLHYN